MLGNWCIEMSFKIPPLNWLIFNNEFIIYVAVPYYYLLMKL